MFNSARYSWYLCLHIIMLHSFCSAASNKQASELNNPGHKRLKLVSLSQGPFCCSLGLSSELINCSAEHLCSNLSGYARQGKETNIWRDYGELPLLSCPPVMQAHGMYDLPAIARDAVPGDS